MAAPTVDVLSPAPSPADSGDVFDAKAFQFTSELSPFGQQIQAVGEYVEAQAAAVDDTIDQAVADATQASADSADAAATSESNAAGSESAALGYRNEAEVFRNETESARDAALALVNFAGKWEDLTGALNTPATVYHLGSYWNLLTDLADVTTSEPANDNADWLFVYTNAELRKSLLDEATLYADFENGDYRLYEGVGAGVVRSKAFGDVFTFTRGSDATGFGASTLETVTTDVARFVYSPELRKRQGLQIEESRTNSLLWSEDFTNAAWSKGGVTVTASSEPTPVGSAFVLQNDGANSLHTLRQNAGGSYAFVVAKYVDTEFLYVGHDNNVNPGATFNLITGEFAQSRGGGSGDGVNPTTISLGDGWFLFGIGTDGSNIRMTIAVSESEFYRPQNAFTSSGSCLIAAAQLEIGAFPTNYIKTEAATVTRAADNCSRTLGAEFNASEGTLLVVAKGRPGETLLTLGGESIVSDEEATKPYAIAYDSDPSATTLDLGDGLFSLAAYIPRKFTPAELEVITQPEAQS